MKYPFQARRMSCLVYYICVGGIDVPPLFLWCSKWNLELFWWRYIFVCYVSGAGTAYPSEHIPGISGVRVSWSWLFHVLFCRSFFVPLSLLFWPLYFLLFFGVQLLITYLIYQSGVKHQKSNQIKSNFSYQGNLYSKYDWN
jgi:hypothetical protein